MGAGDAKGDAKGVANSLLKQTAAEQAFRRRVVEWIGGVLRSDVPNYFKAYVVILLFLCLSASFVLATFLVAEALVLLKTLLKTQHPPVDHVLYASIFTGHGFVAVLLGAPLILRMAAFEEAKRLEADLRRTQSIKQRKRPTVRRLTSKTYDDYRLEINHVAPLPAGYERLRGRLVDDTVKSRGRPDLLCEITLPQGGDEGACDQIYLEILRRVKAGESLQFTFPVRASSKERT